MKGADIGVGWIDQTGRLFFEVLISSDGFGQLKITLFVSID